MAEQKKDDIDNAKKHCRAAIDAVCTRISIRFPHYPNFEEKFKAKCKDEEFDDDINTLMEDMESGYDQSALLEAVDEELNFKDEDKETLCASIHYILKTFVPPVTAFDIADLDTTVTDEEIAEMTKKVETQANELKPENVDGKSLVKILVIGKNHRFPLLTYTMDTYNRWRIQQYILWWEKLTKYKQMSQQQQVQRNVFKNIRIQDFITKMQKEPRFMEHAKGDKGKQILEWLNASLNVFKRRVVSPLAMHPTDIVHTINDSIIVFTYYHISILRAVGNLIRGDKLNLPAQIDFVILPKAIKISPRAQDNDDEDEQSSDSDPDSDASDDEKEDENVSIGSLDERLKNIQNLKKEQLQNKQPAAMQRLFYKMMEELIKEQRSKRMILCVDRRLSDKENQIENYKNYSTGKDTLRKTDDLYAFFPNKAQDIPSGNYLHESLSNLSRTEIFPSANGKDEDVIHSGSQIKEMCLLSIHVHQEDCVRAYWCRNGTVSRFLLSDMVRIWPYHFIEKNYDDNLDKGIEYQSVEKVKEALQNHGKDLNLLRDDNFDSFCRINANLIEEPVKKAKKKKRSFKLKE